MPLMACSARARSDVGSCRSAARRPRQASRSPKNSTPMKCANFSMPASVGSSSGQRLAASARFNGPTRACPPACMPARLPSTALSTRKKTSKSASSMRLCRRTRTRTSTCPEDSRKSFSSWRSSSVLPFFFFPFLIFPPLAASFSRSSSSRLTSLTRICRSAHARSGGQRHLRRFTRSATSCTASIAICPSWSPWTRPASAAAAGWRMPGARSAMRGTSALSRSLA
mmetsp:Transcript_29078/g.72869  ORF Transcript_29078/g.72869 Transcript_29078/m.72869 type:complete len:226 (-) Transcript_29078:513-1190(-)